MFAQYEGFATTDPNAVCLNGAQLGTLTFPAYVQQCLKDENLTSVDNNIIYLKDYFINSYAALKGEYDSLIITLNNVNNLKTKTNSTTANLDERILSLTKKKKELEDELKRYTAEAEAKNQSFLDSILQGRPKETLTPTLQDATLLIFWFGWALLAITLVAVRWLSPGGGWRAGLYAAILLLLVTLCLYAVLQKVA
jgi:hypothetical protein